MSMNEKEILEKMLIVLERLSDLKLIDGDNTSMQKHQTDTKTKPILNLNNIETLRPPLIMPSIIEKNIENKLCNKCGKYLSLSAFNNSKYTKDKKDIYCKNCLKIYRETWLLKVTSINIDESIYRVFENLFLNGKEISFKDIKNWFSIKLKITSTNPKLIVIMNKYINEAEKNGFIIKKKRVVLPGGGGSKSTFKGYKKIPTETQKIIYEQKEKPNIDISNNEIPVTSSEAIIKEKNRWGLFK